MYMFNATPGSLFIRRVTSVMIKGPFRCGSRQFVDELDYFEVAVKKIVTWSAQFTRRPNNIKQNGGCVRS